MKAMKIQAVIFDLDGTLYSRYRVIPAVIWRNLRHLRLLYAERSSRRGLAGLDFPGKDVLKEHFFILLSLKSGKSVEYAKNWYYNTYMPSQVAALRNVGAYGWAKFVLETLKDEGKKIVLYSDYDCAGEKLAALGLRPELFDIVTDSFALGGFKPCVESFRKIADMLGVEPHSVVVVGDRADTDGLGASASGMHYLKVTGE